MGRGQDSKLAWQVQLEEYTATSLDEDKTEPGQEQPSQGQPRRGQQPEVRSTVAPTLHPPDLIAMISATSAEYRRVAIAREDKTTGRPKKRHRSNGDLVVVESSASTIIVDLNKMPTTGTFRKRRRSSIHYVVAECPNLAASRATKNQKPDSATCI